MKLIKNIALTLSLSILSLTVSAELISTDYKVEGDGKATLNTETGREWLDFDVTKNKTKSEMDALLTTTYQGWRYPTLEELESFAMATGAVAYETAKYPDQAFYIPDVRLEYGRTVFNYHKALSMVDLLGKTHYSSSASTNPRTGPNHDYYATGRVYIDGTSYFLRAHAQKNSLYTGYLRYVSGLNTSEKYSGFLLVSDGGTTLSSRNNPELNSNNPNAPVNVNVSVPATLGLLSLSIMGLLRRKTQKVS
jgi:hypothetical protein